MNRQEIDTAADALFEAERTGVQTGLLTKAHPSMGMDDAYAVQAALLERKYAAGRTRIGWKIGLTSRAMQMALGIDIPDSGVLTDEMAFPTGAIVPKGRFIQPRIEAEIAFLMGADLAGADVSRNAVLGATQAVAPALEILDTRIVRADPQTGAARKVFDTISDNAANAGVVLGEARHAVDAFDLRWVGAIVARDDTVEETGLGAGVLNDPVESMVWLVRRLAQYGQGLRAGEVVLSGSFIRPVECPPGTRIAADFGAFGRVDLSFA